MAQTKSPRAVKAEMGKKGWSKRKGAFADVEVGRSANLDGVVPFFLGEVRKNDRKMAHLPIELRGRSTIAFSNGRIRVSVDNDNPVYEKFINGVAKKIVQMLRVD
jgi:hypothetical protein